MYGNKVMGIDEMKKFVKDVVDGNVVRLSAVDHVVLDEIWSDCGSGFDESDIEQYGNDNLRKVVSQWGLQQVMLEYEVNRLFWNV